ncbi:MAG: hypothetical protein QNI87_04120 [Erythrobacter sp.]|uniref:hypothetical protein n=1 Tax=Erythrobacter sp. TaxID=1042 RepID=UPI00262C0AF0|nr:hypothetical protein [Erythrobacter sp.]MDJ0977700.1 hypothetical protein [Erythrobacter sp.]
MREKDGATPRYPDPREEDIMAGDRRLSRPDASVPDWEVPDTSYRPIPIVWFTGAFLLHLMAVLAILTALGLTGLVTPWLAVPAAAIAAGAIGAWTWERGMRDAGAGWKVSTALFLAFNTLFALAASA